MIVNGVPAEPGSVTTTGTDVLSVVVEPAVGSTVELVTVIGATVGMANDIIILLLFTLQWINCKFQAFHICHGLFASCALELSGFECQF